MQRLITEIKPKQKKKVH